MSAVRYAVYFVPADGSSLAQFGHEVLGRDAAGHPVAAPEPDHEWRVALTRTAAHYGFHATLKAPFELCDDRTLEALQAATGALASEFEPVELTSLHVTRLTGFSALALTSGSVEESAVNALAARCVSALEAFRAPLSAVDHKRREAVQLEPRQRVLLSTYGYPYVMDEFRFHMTLSSRLQAEQSSFLTWLQARWQAHSTAPDATVPRLDRLALCTQAGRDSAFVRLAEYPLPAQVGERGA